MESTNVVKCRIISTCSKKNKGDQDNTHFAFRLKRVSVDAVCIIEVHVVIQILMATETTKASQHEIQSQRMEIFLCILQMLVCSSFLVKMKNPVNFLSTSYSFKRKQFDKELLSIPFPLI